MAFATPLPDACSVAGWIDGSDRPSCREAARAPPHCSLSPDLPDRENPAQILVGLVPQWPDVICPYGRLRCVKKAAYAALVRQHSLKKKVEYAPVIFEVSGGFPDSVSQLLNKATEVASKNKVKLAASDWSWSAMDWSSFHAQVLSFEINKMTALAVLNGLRSAVAAVEAAN